MTDGLPVYGDTRTVADRFGLSAATLNTLRTRGGGPTFCKRGSRVIYRLDDVVAWIEKDRRANTADVT
jgi:hypothetical protein